MISIVYEIATGRIKEFHEYSGTPWSFSQLVPQYAVWHVPQEAEEAVSRTHIAVTFRDGKPVGTEGRLRVRVKAEIADVPKLWGLPSALPKGEQKRVLIVRFRGLGDVLMTWFALEQLRKQQPDTHITYLTSPEAAALFCGQKALVDRLIYMRYDHHARAETVEIPIDTKGYDEVYNLMNAVDSGPVVYTKPRADNFADLLGVEIPKSPEVRQLAISESETEWFRKTAKWRLGQKIVACQLDSNGRPRVWPTDHWRSLAKLCNKAGMRMAFLSTSPEHRDMKLPNNVTNLSCRTTVRQFIAAIWLSDVVVCTDTSGLHIGGMSPTQVVGLFGSTGKTLTGEWAHTNYYNNIHYIQSPTACCPCWDWQLESCDGEKHCPVCMWNIRPEKVTERLKEAVGNAEGDH